MKYSVSFRIWHWLNAFVIFGLLATVGLRKTFLSWRTNSEIIIDKLFDFDIEITEQQAKILAKAIRAGMWDWHIILGYALMFLIIFRVYLYFCNATNKPAFSSLDLHKKGVQILYYIFYITLFFMTISGFFLEFYKELGVSKTFAHDIKELHELVFYFIMFFSASHIVGVVIAEIKDEKGLISNMISGYKKI
jgi:cytochrome b561